MQKEAINQKQNLSDVDPYIVSEVNARSWRPKSGVGYVGSRVDIAKIEINGGLKVLKSFKKHNDGPNVVDMTNFIQIINYGSGLLVKDKASTVAGPKTGK